MRVKLILNPCADHGRGQQKQGAIAEAARPFGGMEVVLTEYAGHGTELARQAAEAGFDVVVAAGGDGTISDVVNGLMQTAVPRPHLGIIPLGSGNDLAWSLGIPHDDIATAVAIIFQGHICQMDLGFVRDNRGHTRYFDNNLGVGFDAQVVIETEKIKRIHGFLMYIWATLRTIFFYFNKPTLTMQFDDVTVQEAVIFVTFGLGVRHGGGYFITPAARHDDDLIDTCLVRPVSRLTMLVMLLRVMRGTHVTHPAITMRQNRKITIQADADLPIHVDGEVFAYPEDHVRQLTVTSLPAAIGVCVLASHPK
jgi:YegS/Rv2252/BmrU family lipid kinase